MENVIYDSITEDSYVSLFDVCLRSGEINLKSFLLFLTKLFYTME